MGAKTDLPRPDFPEPSGTAGTANERSSFRSFRRPTEQPREQGGPKGLEPTRYGDWERRGRCIDF